MWVQKQSKRGIPFRATFTDLLTFVACLYVHV